MKKSTLQTKRHHTIITIALVVAAHAGVRISNDILYTAIHNAMRTGNTGRAISLMRFVAVKEPVFWASPGRSGKPAIIHGLRDSGRTWNERHLWTLRTGKGIRSSATFASGAVYIGSNDDHLYKIDPASGAVIWKYDTKGDIETQPLVIGNVVYVASHKGITALDTRNAKRIWHHKLIWAESSPLHDPSTGYIVAGSNDNRLVAVNRTDGKPAWVFRTRSPVESWPALAGGRIFAATNGGDLYAIDARSGRQLWHFIGSGTIEGPVLTSKGLVFAASKRGRVYAISAHTGRLVWRHDVKGRVEESLGLSGSLLIIGDNKGKITAFDQATGATKWVFAGAGWVEAPITSHGDTIFAACHYGYLYAIDAGTGKLRWRYLTGWDIDESGPLAFGNTVIVGSLDGFVYAFRARYTEYQ